MLRGGYGIYYERLSGELILLDVGQIPFSLTQSRIGSPNAAATLANPFVPALPPSSAFPIFFPRTPDSSLSVGAISGSIRSPYSQQYNLNLQYEFARRFPVAGRICRVGNKTSRWLSPIQPGTGRDARKSRQRSNHHDERKSRTACSDSGTRGRIVFLRDIVQRRLQLAADQCHEDERALA